MSRNRIRLTALLSTALLVSCWAGTDHAKDQEAAPDASREDDAASREVDALVSVVDYGQMRGFPEHWRRDLSGEGRKRFLLALLKRLRATRELPLKDYADTFVPSRVATGAMRFHGHGHMILQDVFLENGRCAWAAEQLLGCALPTIDVATNRDQAKLDETVRSVYLKVIEVMDWPREKAAAVGPGGAKPGPRQDAKRPVR